MRLSSPAKINLFLRIIKKRKDGYHEIETLFERINLCDEIVLKSVPQGIRIRCSYVGAGLVPARHGRPRGSPLPKGPANLAYQAAKILQEEFKIKKGVEIIIRKKIPIAAGLGGGSSNAATVLLGLNRLWKLNCSRKKLIKLGASLGSDVPFFILETPFALGKGRGEILKPISLRGVRLWHCLVKPRFGISTRALYSAWRSSFLTPPKPDVKILCSTLKKDQPGRLKDLLFNSLEHIENKQVKSVLGLKKTLLRSGASAALMSGSGSTVFGVFSSKVEAEEASRHLRRLNKTWKVFAVSTS